MNNMADEEPDGSQDWNGASDVLLAYKKQFAQFGIFIAFLVVLFALTAAFSALSAGASRKGLQDCLAAALADRGYGDVTLDGLHELQNPFAVSAQAYTVSGSKYSYAVIIKLTTMVGPVPAVFLYDGSSARADFLCYLSLSKRVERMLLDSTEHSLLDYWSLRLPSIISASAEEVQQ